MDNLDIMRARHAVRSYLIKPIEEEKRSILIEAVNAVNAESSFHFQLCFDEPKAFSSFMAHYGHFENVQNYLVLAARKNQDEPVGYEGEKIVLKLQEIGLNSCWVGLTYAKRKASIALEKGEKVYGVIAFGYGATKGIPHSNKDIAVLTHLEGTKPTNWDEIVEAALLAPTAVNQQKFLLSCIDGKMSIALRGNGFFAKVDLGIVKYHVEVIGGVKIDG